MPSIDIDDALASYLARFKGFSANEALRALLGFEPERDARTPTEAFRNPVLQVLASQQGPIQLQRLYRLVEQRMSLVPADYGGAEPRWWNNIRQLARKLRTEGLLQPGSEDGLWEITDDGRREAGG